MRYSPYVTYGHQGLVLGQHPAQPLSGNSSVLLDLQFLFKDHYSAKGYTPQSILALDRNNRFFSTPRHLLWRLRSSNGSGKLFRYRLRSGENWGLRLPAGVCHLSPLLCFNSLCSGASPGNSAGKPEHWAGSSNRGRCCSTQHPFITGITRIAILSQVL